MRRRQKASHVHWIQSGFPFLEKREQPAVIFVTSGGDGIAVDGLVTLREAITSTNANASVNADVVPIGAYIVGAVGDVIGFKLGFAATITPTSGLPFITDPVAIDGSTQPSYSGTPVITITGTKAGFTSCFNINTFGCEIRGLAINSFEIDGVAIFTSKASGNRVVANYLGTDKTGTIALGNGGAGVRNFDPNMGNVIGGPGIDGNLISGNGAGVIIADKAGGAFIRNNRIGTDVTGTLPLGNKFGGVLLEDSFSNIVGVDLMGVGEPNVIGGNDDGVIISDTVANPSMSLGNLINRNFIGTDRTGKLALPNDVYGVFIKGVDAKDNEVRSNAICCNPVGVRIEAAASDNSIFANIIGLGSGGIVLPGQIGGVEVMDAFGNFIGTPGAGMTNVIADSTGTGILISGTKSAMNKVENNIIGTDSSGKIAKSNDIGVDIADAPGTIVFDNQISGNVTVGLRLRGLAMGSFVIDNQIGTDSTGLVALPNGTGVVIADSAMDNEIGINLISGNKSNGVLVSAVAIAGFANRIVGNDIGFNAGKMPSLPNGGNGVRIDDGLYVSIGLAVPASGNRIAGNKLDGVAVTGSADFVSIRGNSISGHTDLGIDLTTDGITANDTMDPDLGPNTLQNFPTLTSALAAITLTEVAGTFNSSPLASFTLDFYANSATNPSGNAEGERYLGAVTIMTDAAGDATFSTSLPMGSKAGDLITATATNSAGATSEFSLGFKAAAPAPPTISSVVINAGAAQRSRVTQLDVAFSETVTLPTLAETAFVLTRQSDSKVVTLSALVDNSGPMTKVMLTPVGGPITAGSLDDGRYTLTVLASKVSGSGGPLDGNGDMTGGDDYVLIGSPANGLFRLFGDAVGNGTVNTTDFNAFRSAFGGSSVAFDYDGLGGVGTLDFNQFRLRFGSSV